MELPKLPDNVKKELDNYIYVLLAIGVALCTSQISDPATRTTLNSIAMALLIKVKSA